MQIRKDFPSTLDLKLLAYKMEMSAWKNLVTR